MIQYEDGGNFAVRSLFEARRLSAALKLGSLVVKLRQEDVFLVLKRHRRRFQCGQGGACSLIAKAGLATT